MSHEPRPKLGDRPAEPRGLRVMTFNVRVRTLLDFRNPWTRRRGLVAETIRRFDPDLLGTQECLTEQADDLRAALPAYSFFGAGRRDGQTRGETCGVFFRSDAFEQLDGGHFWLSRTPDVPGSRGWGEPFPRMVTWVKLRDRGGSAREPFHFLNTHFAVLSARARVRSAAMLREWLARVAGDGPAIVTGDFNAAEGTPPYVALVGPGTPQLFDVYRRANPTRTRDEGTSHLFLGRRRGARIDWIVATPHFQPVAADIIRDADASGAYPSDHFPVGAVLSRSA